MLDEYEGGHQNYPIAHDVVDRFVRDYKSGRKTVLPPPGKQFSLRNNSKGIAKGRKSYYNEYASNVMQWAHSPSTEEGDVNYFNKHRKEYGLVKATTDGYIELFTGTYEEVRQRYEQSYEQRTVEIYGDSFVFRADEGGNLRNLPYVGDNGSYGRGGDSSENKYDNARGEEYLRRGNNESEKYSLRNRTQAVRQMLM
ncbi:MAG: hypothetical protein E7626_00265 [Ruminococcaceae bacterium]|nr:hypothetical protein [Oscillospiraceae bacterium]